MMALILLQLVLTQGSSSGGPAWDFTTDLIGKLPTGWETRGDAPKRNQLSGPVARVSRNLAEDYKTAFGSTPPALIGIGVKTDSDSTHTSRQADYDDLRLERR